MEPRLAPVPVAAAITTDYGGHGVAVRQRGTRNGLPLTVPYAYRARRYPWAQRANAAAEARYGKPRPVCVCGAPLRHEQAAFGGRCERC